MKIYFAGSIRGGRDDKTLYLEIIGLLRKYGTVLTEHVGGNALPALGESNLTDTYIYDRDMAWLKEADVVVAEVTTPSFGVGYEVGNMEGKKPILCLYREQHGKRVSAMIGGNKKVTIERYRTTQDLDLVFAKFFEQIRSKDHPLKCHFDHGIYLVPQG